MGISSNCAVGRAVLPVVPCNEKRCPWFVYNVEHCNCFFNVSEYMDDFPGCGGFELEEIAVMEGTTVQEIIKIIEDTEKKIRIKNKMLLIHI
jgi:hypothetical protein